MDSVLLITSASGCVVREERVATVIKKTDSELAHFQTDFIHSSPSDNRARFCPVVSHPPGQTGLVGLGVCGCCSVIKAEWCRFPPSAGVFQMPAPCNTVDTSGNLPG